MRAELDEASDPDPSPGPPQKTRAGTLVVTDEHVPCLAWSQHAAELAESLVEDIVRWPDSPTTDALIADGLLTRIMPEVLLPPDRLGTAVSRVLALGCAIGPALRAEHVIAGVSAAWVHAGGPPPPRPVLVSSSHRAVIGGVRVRSVALEPGDVETLGGAPVTTPQRTVLDLVREDGDRSRQALDLLLRSGHVAHIPLREHSERVLGRDRREQLEAALRRAHGPDGTSDRAGGELQDACIGEALSMG